MKKLLFIGWLVNFIVCSVEGQVGIGTNNPNSSSMLEVSSGDSKNFGFLGPKVQLISSNTSSPISSPKKGLIVYNTETTGDLIPGYYFWDGTQWQSMTERKTYAQYYVDGIRVAVLGYYPFEEGANTPETVEYGDITATKAKCIKNTANTNFASHSYCGYNLNRTISFEESFNIAKTIGGFIPVITTNEEWNYLRTNLVNTISGDIWIGYSRATYPGTEWNNQYIWITGEKSKINWSQTNNSGAPIETNFISTETFSGNCSYINGSNSNKYWQTRDCVDKGNANYLIVELLN